MFAATTGGDGIVDQPLIKILLLVAIVVITAMLNASSAGARHQAVRRLMLGGFVLLAAMAVLFPVLLTRVAQVLGVGRGADLLLYGLTVFFLGYVASSYRRMRHMEQQVTTLAREMALRAAIHDTKGHHVRPGTTTGEKRERLEGHGDPGHQQGHNHDGRLGGRGDHRRPAGDIDPQAPPPRPVGS